MLWYCLGNKHAALLWGNCAAACQPSPWLLHLNYGAAENQWTVSMYFTLCLPLFSSLIKPVISFLTTQFRCTQLEVTTALQLQSIGQGNEICIFSLYNTKAVKDLKNLILHQCFSLPQKRNSICSKVCFAELHVHWILPGKKALSPLLSI